MGMHELVRMKKGWPGNGQQFCTIHLKGVPFLNWIDEIDPMCEAVVLIGKRREESPARVATPEFVESSEYHGGRLVWHPLYLHSELLRNELLHRAGFEVLPHRR
jgi:3'-phosphoadenosine 5'-phosphosulfate sulfotransferase (PAPS reductase)/FAD synthetase